MLVSPLTSALPRGGPFFPTRPLSLVNRVLRPRSRRGADGLAPRAAQKPISLLWQVRMPIPQTRLMLFNLRWEIAGNRDPRMTLRGCEGLRSGATIASDPVAPSHFPTIGGNICVAGLQPASCSGPSAHPVGPFFTAAPRSRRNPFAPCVPTMGERERRNEKPRPGELSGVGRLAARPALSPLMRIP